jgi:hypothetical protein
MKILMILIVLMETNKSQYLGARSSGVGWPLRYKPEGQKL